MENGVAATIGGETERLQVQVCAGIDEKAGKPCPYSKPGTAARKAEKAFN